MIHAYEYMLPENYRQFLTIMLFDKLQKRIPRLLKKIKKDMHTLLQIHEPLFLLKSFDLDLRLRKPLGTVYNYERTILHNK